MIEKQPLQTDTPVHPVTIPPSGLEGNLVLPREGMGLVLFAHGSGSGRHSPRNTWVAARLHEAGLGTLLFDLLTEDEGRDRARVFDIDLLARRLLMATEWISTHAGVVNRPIGYFGASTGAAAALVAAVSGTRWIGAVVSRGGRPDLAGPALRKVTSPTLLIVGGNDEPVLTFNRRAYAELPGEKDFIVIPGAGHLFEEPEALAQVARHAGRWFAQHLTTLPSTERVEPDRT